MTIRYHKNTLDLLRIDNIFDTNLNNIDFSLLNKLNHLPKSVAEWLMLQESLKWWWRSIWDKDDTSNKDILTYYSNDDPSWIGLYLDGISEDDEDIYHTTEGKRLLGFMTENQNNFFLTFDIDTWDDPPVYYADHHRKKWVLHFDSFSDFVFCQIFKWQYLMTTEGPTNSVTERYITYYETIKATNKNELEAMVEDLEFIASSRYYWADQYYKQEYYAYNQHCRIVTTQQEDVDEINISIYAIDNLICDTLKVVLEKQQTDYRTAS